jgi:DNA-binding response OmpR family regulator
VVVHPVPTKPEPSRAAPAGDRERAAWLVLATDGPAIDLPGLIADTSIRVTGDPRRFRDVLLAERPRIVVCSQPPAGSEELELVIAERRRRSRLRAVHLTPPTAVDERLAALAMGFDDALTTSVSGSELAGRLAWFEARATTRTPGGASLPVADDLDLDLSAHELRRGEAAVHLRPKEFGLLALLASHPGRAYTRRELLDRVWGSGHESGPRTVDVHVRWLRSKIEPDPERPTYLVTVRGVGYRLDPPTA